MNSGLEKRIRSDAGRSIAQEHIQQGFMNPDTAVVVNRSGLAEVVHEVVHARPGTTDHVRQFSLGYLWNQRILVLWATVRRHEQQDSRQPGRPQLGV